MLALSRQLVGERAFGARGFRYCGSLIGRGTVRSRSRRCSSARARWRTRSTRDFGLVGLNGIDFIARAGVPWPIEVNPRYSASMELLERRDGTPLFALHADACAGRLPHAPPHRTRSVLGKAVVFARRGVTLGDTRDWLRDPAIADVPHPGEQIPRGRPICTVFASGRNAAACLRALTVEGGGDLPRGRARGSRCGMSEDRVLQAVTCLGCGCGCDDLTVRVRAGRIAELSPPCSLARRWFGDGQVPGEIRVEGRPATIEKAIDAAVAVLSVAARPLVLIAPDLTTEAQRTAIALGDTLRAEVDGATSDSAAAGILVAQRRGRAAASLGEIRNRADVVLFWAVDPSERYPRYLERYAAATSTTHVGRRALLSVSIGADRGPEKAEVEAEFTPGEEVDALAVMQATVRGQRLGELPARLRPAAAIAERLLQGKYVAIVHDAETGREARDAQRTEGLVALTQVLNGPTRAALSSLRSGGNRSGAEAALTWQTGYPLRVSFSGGLSASPAGSFRPRPASCRRGRRRSRGGLGSGAGRVRDRARPRSGRRDRAGSKRGGSRPGSHRHRRRGDSRAGNRISHG